MERFLWSTAKTHQKAGIKTKDASRKTKAVGSRRAGPRYTAKERTLNACRAYFIFTATEAGANDFTFDINFGDGTDAITGVKSAPMADAETWFTLDSKKLSSKPTKKGFYVTNGQRAIIK